MTHLYDDDTNDFNYTTMEQKVDAAGRKSVALQSVKISNPAPKPKSILKKQWSETDTYSGGAGARSVTPPPPPLLSAAAATQREQLLRQDSDSSSPVPDPPKSSSPVPTASSPAASSARPSLVQKVVRTASGRRLDGGGGVGSGAGAGAGDGGLTTYEMMVDHQTESFNI
jgi:hypothetical protein